jgi:large subunit ribosomal protein L4
MLVDILKINGDHTGRSVELPDDVFGIEPNEHVVYLSVKAYLAAQRQGTHKSKERSEISGSTRKLKRQKGTGGARAGDINSPLFPGGGRVFGPKPRDYEMRLNKKIKRLARKSALSEKVQAGNLIVIEDFSFDAPKTKEYIKLLQAIKVDSSKTLLVTKEYEKEVYLSSRNLQRTVVMRSQDLNTYQILNAQKLIISEGAIPKIVECF